MKKQNIVAQRIALYACQKEFEDRCHDETWMDTCYTVKKSWRGEETPGVIPCKHGQRIIVVHRCQPR